MVSYSLEALEDLGGFFSHSLLLKIQLKRQKVSKWYKVDQDWPSKKYLFISVGMLSRNGWGWTFGLPIVTRLLR